MFKLGIELNPSFQPVTNTSNSIFKCDYYQLQLIDYLCNPEKSSNSKKQQSEATSAYFTTSPTNSNSSNRSIQYDRSKSIGYQIDIMINKDNNLKYKINDTTGLLVEILKADIVEQQVDAITNASNEFLALGGKPNCLLTKFLLTKLTLVYQLYLTTRRCCR